MSVTATFPFNLQVQETLDTNVDAAAAPVVRHTGFASNVRLDAATTPAATKVYVDTVALVAGAKTIDLTSLGSTGGGTFSATGLKVRGIMLHNTSANPLTISPGASNPYPLFGTANAKVVRTGGRFMEYFADGLAAVSGSVKTIDFAGTGTDTFNLILLFG